MFCLYTERCLFPSEFTFLCILIYLLSYSKSISCGSRYSIGSNTFLRQLVFAIERSTASLSVLYVYYGQAIPEGNAGGKMLNCHISMMHKGELGLFRKRVIDLWSNHMDQ
ncbi:hypothetical protein FKM82_020551 [Ascaphus truei]